MCGYADHRDEDHRNGSFDANYRVENGNVTWDRPQKGGAKGDNKKGGNKGGRDSFIIFSELQARRVETQVPARG